MRKRERENPCGICGHYHKYEEVGVYAVYGHHPPAAAAGQGRQREAHHAAGHSLPLASPSRFFPPSSPNHGVGPCLPDLQPAVGLSLMEPHPAAGPLHYALLHELSDAARQEQTLATTAVPDGGAAAEVHHAAGHSLPLASPSRIRSTTRSGDADSVAKMKAAAEALEAKEKEKPSFELSGKLAEETNRVAGVNLLYSEPPEGRKPDIRWRLYVFKGGEPLNDPLYVHRLSCYLFGRERKVADIPTDHPSCSKQHAVLQYRLVEKEQPDGMMSKKVRPYLMDLDSTNGTYINENRIEPRRYYELFEKDTIKFGNSSREYVLLHENSTQ